jgi:hypothetical protein
MDRPSLLVRRGLNAAAVAGAALVPCVVSSWGWVRPAFAQEEAPAPTAMQGTGAATGAALISIA